MCFVGPNGHAEALLIAQIALLIGVGRLAGEQFRSQRLDKFRGCSPACAAKGAPARSRHIGVTELLLKITPLSNNHYVRMVFRRIWALADDGSLDQADPTLQMAAGNTNVGITREYA